MNKKQFLILAALLLVVGGASLWLLRQRSASWNETGQRLGEKLLGTFDVNAISHVVIRQGTNELNLVKKGEPWTVRERADYPASFNEISDVIRKLAELKVIQSEQVGPSLRPRLELVEPGKGTNSGTLVEFRAGDKVVKSLLLGKRHLRGAGEEGFPDGRYILVGNSDSVAVVSDPLSNVEPNPATFLAKDFFKAEKIRIITMTSAVASNSWQIARESESAEWKLGDVKPGEQLDPTKVSGLANALVSPSFVDVVPGAKPEQTGLDKPTIIGLETFDGLTYLLKVGAKSGEENHYFSVAVAGEAPKTRPPGKDEKPEDKARLDKEFADNRTKLEDRVKAEKLLAPWTYLVARWTVEPLLRERHQLMVDKKDDKPDGAAPPGGLPGGIPGLNLPTFPPPTEPK